MSPSKAAVGAGRVVPALSEVQKRSQATRLGQAVPSLAAAYAQALARWMGDPVLRLAGLPIVTESYRSPERQDELYRQGRSKPGPVVTYKRGGESKHNILPSRALDVAFLLADESVSWSGLLLSKFARLVKAADARVRWGGDFRGILRTGRILRCRAETKRAGQMVRSFCFYCWLEFSWSNQESSAAARRTTSGRSFLHKSLSLSAIAG